ncbi:MAG: hypothetical protein KDD85_11625 [Parvularculaceae bacterium]|nr:hypothetical protein [Parvularculaceae bacterium]
MSRTQPNFVLMPEEEEERSPVDALRRRALRLLQQADERPGENERVRRVGCFAAPAALGPVEAAPARAFAVGAVTMPAVFVVVVLVALAVFGKPATSPQSDETATVETLTQPHARAATGATFAATSGFENNAIGIGEDSRIEGVSLDGDRIALHVESPNGAEIIVYDYVEGRVIALAPIVTAGIAEGDGLARRAGAPPIARLSLITPADEQTLGQEVATKADDAPSAPRVKPQTAN